MNDRCVERTYIYRVEKFKRENDRSEINSIVQESREIRKKTNEIKVE